MLNQRHFFPHENSLCRLAVYLLLCALWLPVNARAALEIMAEDDAAPWAQRDGRGAAVDIVKAAFAAANVKLVIHTVVYARCKHMVLNGEIAACFSMSADASIADKVVFSDQPLYRVYAQYFRNAQKPLPVKNETEIQRGTVVGIVTGYEYPASVTELALRGVILEPAGSEIANLKKLAAGRIDATVANLDALKSEEFLTQAAHVEGAVTPLFRSPEFGSYIGFSTLHPQGLWARDKFNEGYDRISRDGTLKKIMTRWQSLQHK